MKILFVSESYYPYQSGVPVVVKYLAEGLAMNNDVSVATCIEPSVDLPLVETINQVDVHRYVIFRTITKRIKGDIKRFQEEVSNCNYDIIVVECPQSTTTDALLPIIERINCKKVLHAHGLSGLLVKPIKIKTDFKHTIGNTYYWVLMKYYYGLYFKKKAAYFDASISLTDCDSGYNYLTKLIKKNYVLGNAVDDMFFEPSKDKYILPSGDIPYVVSIANYTVVKNQINMLRQFYKTKHKEYALIMIGSSKNDYYRQLEIENEKLAKKYGRRPVYLLTGINRKFFPYILDHAKIYLVSSLYEEFSISIIEAMARQLPFVSTNVGNAKQLPGGIVCEEMRFFCNAIDKLLDDENKRLEMGREAKNYAFNNCRRETAVQKLEKILIDM